MAEEWLSCRATKDDNTMNLYLWIAAGGALGSVARFGAAEGITRLAGMAFPWGTLVVNVAGSFVIGFFATATSPVGRWPVGIEGRHFFMTGVLGGFTTFSAFRLQTIELFQAGHAGRALANIALSLLLCLAATWLGHWLAGWVKG